MFVEGGEWILCQIKISLQKAYRRAIICLLKKKKRHCRLCLDALVPAWVTKMVFEGGEGSGRLCQNKLKEGL